MFKELMFLAALTVLTASSPVSHVFEIDISPEEAQKYLNSPPFTDPQLSSRTAVLPLVRWDSPSFRAAEAGPTIGHYWKNGKEIENTGDYDEEVYDASQYHGQDGLGAYAYGYQGPDSSKVENRVHSGDVTGSYAYKAGNDLIKVRYWADSQGFHQEDNIPKVVLEPVQEAEDVRQARLAHEKAWQEAAAAAAQQPDPQGEYNSQYDQGAQYQGAASEQQSTIVAAAPAQASEAREGKAYFAQAQSSFQSGQQGQLRAQNQGQYSQQGQFSAQGQGQQGQYGQLKAQSQAYQGQQGQQAHAQAQYGGAQQGQYSGAQGQQSGAQGQGSGAQDGQYQPKEDEEQGPPRGFFYSFNYPVSVIVAKNAGQGGQVQPGHPIDHDTVGITSQH